MSNSKPKIDDLGDGKLKTFPKNFKKSSYVVSKKVVKDKKCNILNTKVNNLEKKTPVATNLIQINQYNTENYNLEKN